MKRMVLAAVVIGTMLVGSEGVSAGQRGSGGPKPKMTSGGQAPKGAQGNKGGQAGGGAAARGGGQAASAAAQAGGKGAGNAQGARGGGAKSGGREAGTQASGRKPAKSTTSDGSSVTSTSSTGSSTSSTPTSTLTPVQQKLERNTQLADKLRSRLPEGTNLMDAVDGFRNLGQAVAAINVSSNHNISFTELKTRMVDDGMSLGQAIQDVRRTSDAEAKTIARQADTEATTLIRTTEAESAKKAPKTKSRG